MMGSGVRVPSAAPPNSISLSSGESGFHSPSGNDASAPKTTLHPSAPLSAKRCRFSPAPAANCLAKSPPGAEPFGCSMALLVTKITSLLISTKRSLVGFPRRQKTDGDLLPKTLAGSGYEKPSELASSRAHTRQKALLFRITV